MQYRTKAILILLLFPLFLSAQECMDAKSDDGVSVIGFIQPQMEYNFLGDNIKGESLDEMDFYFNRARIGVTGNIPYDFGYYAIAELSPTLHGPFLLDAFITYNRFKPFAKVTLGQFKAPFGNELPTPCHKLTTINRSLVVQNLASPWRDLGIMVSGGTGERKIFGKDTKDFLTYKIAVMNGTGLNVRDDNRKKEIVGRLAITPVEFLTVAASYKFGKHPATATGVEEDDERSRFGVDATIKFMGISLMGEYISGSDIGSYTIGGGCGDPLQVIEGSVDRSGFFAQIMYETPWNVQPVIRYEQYDPNMDEEIGVNDQQSILTFGVNYFFNEWTRLQINYLYKAEENGLVEVPNDALVIQAQVVF